MENLAHPAEATPRPTKPSMISPDEALRLVLDTTWQLPAEPRAMAETLGLVLAEPVVADRDQPPFDRSMMDGYALSEGVAGRKLPVID